MGTSLLASLSAVVGLAHYLYAFAAAQARACHPLLLAPWLHKPFLASRSMRFLCILHHTSLGRPHLSQFQNPVRGERENAPVRQPGWQKAGSGSVTLRVDLGTVMGVDDRTEGAVRAVTEHVNVVRRPADARRATAATAAGLLTLTGRHYAMQTQAAQQSSKVHCVDSFRHGVAEARLSGKGILREVARRVYPVVT